MHTSENNFLITEQEMLGMSSLVHRLQFFIDLLSVDQKIQTDSNALSHTLGNMKEEIETIHDNIYSRFTSRKTKK